MRKGIIICLLMVFTLVILNAQTPSFMNTFSAGLYRSERDAAFQVSEAQAGPLFSTLQYYYIFTGLTNWFARDAESGTSLDPVAAGFYVPGANPWSFFTQFSNETEDSARSNGPAAITTGTVAVADGTTTTNHTWITSITDNQYTALESTDLFLNTLMILKLGAMNLGIDVSVGYQNNVGSAPLNAWADNNNTSTQTVNYNTTGAGAIPTPAQDYTITTTAVNPDYLLILSAGVPFFMQLGAMKLYNNSSVQWVIRDASSSTKTAYSSPASGPMAFAGIAAENSTTDVMNGFSINSDTVLSFAPIWGGHNDNRLDFIVNAGADITMPSNSTSYNLDYDINFAAAAAAQAITAYNTDTSTTNTRKGYLDWSLTPGFQHFFYFEPVQDIFFAFAPQFVVNVAYNTPGTSYTSQQEQVTKIDIDANGVYDAADTVVTVTTINYNNADDNTYLGITPICMLPASFRVSLKDLPFEIILGNIIYMACEFQMYNTLPNSTRTTTVTADGAGTVAGTVITTNYSVPENSRFLTNWSFANMFTFGLNFKLPADISLYVNLNLNDFLDFEDLQAELIIPVKIPATK